MAKILPFRDTLINLLSGLGTSKDKTTGAVFAYAEITRSQLEAAYRSDWITRKVIDVVPKDATREWREWQAEAEEITKLEKLEKQFDIQGKVKKAMIKARLYGGAALILGVDGAGETYEELKIDRVRANSLKFVHVVHRHEISTGELETDLTLPNYQLPKEYLANSAVAAQVKIHPSRVIRFMGNEIPDPAQSMDGWGDSILQAVDDAVRGAGIVTGGIAALVQEAKVDIIKIPDLSAKLSTDEYAKKLANRLGYANVIKSNHNALVMDTDEEWERVQVSFAALPDILQMYLMIASGACDIPVTRLLGQSPRGLNATGEHDSRNYYDMIKSEQNSMLRPALEVLDQVLQRSALGKYDEEITYEWRPLWQMDEGQKSEIATRKATVFKADVDAGLLDANALKLARENQLIEDGTYPGLEMILQAQEAGEIDTQETQFEHDPEMNPDHPQNKASLELAQNQAKMAGKPPQKKKFGDKWFVKTIDGYWQDPETGRQPEFGAKDESGEIV